MMKQNRIYVTEVLIGVYANRLTRQTCAAAAAAALIEKSCTVVTANPHTVCAAAFLTGEALLNAMTTAVALVLGDECALASIPK